MFLLELFEHRVFGELVWLDTSILLERAFLPPIVDLALFFQVMSFALFQLLPHDLVADFITWIDY